MHRSGPNPGPAQEPRICCHRIISSAAPEFVLAREDRPIGNNKRIRTLAKPAATGSKRVNKKAAEASTNILRRLKRFASGVTFERLAFVIRTANAALVFASVIYALTMFSLLAVPLGGRNHICRAFYLSLVTVLLLSPGGVRPERPAHCCCICVLAACGYWGLSCFSRRR